MHTYHESKDKPIYAVRERTGFEKMKFYFRQFSFGVAILIFAAAINLTFGQTPQRDVNMVLSQRNPDGWFTILIPKSVGNATRFADVDGGFYDASDIRITFSYWTFENTPNFVRNGGPASQEELVLVCSKSRQALIFRTKIASRKAIVQRCPETGAGNFRYLYYVNFPKLDVFDGELYGSGTFTLTINYNNRNYVSFASRIARSIRFLPKEKRK